MKKKKQVTTLRERLAAFYLNKATKAYAKYVATKKVGTPEETLVLYHKYLKYKRLYSKFTR